MALRRVRRTARAGIEEATSRWRRKPRSVTDLTDRELGKLRDRVHACLDPRLSGVAVRNRAADVAEVIAQLDRDGLRRFFTMLVEELGPQPAELRARLAEVTEALAPSTGPTEQAGASGDAATGASTTTTTSTTSTTDEAAAATTTGDPDRLDTAQLRAVEALRDACAPRWETLFELLCGLAGGVKLAVDLRAELLALLPGDKHLRPLDHDLRQVLSRLFPPGLLELRRITWDSPGSLLEKLIAYEAVHAITSWDDLKNRLDDHDRRCYAFIHPGMPDEPIIFVEVALLDEIASDVVTLLDVSAPKGVADREATTAIFYSISACQPGLAGVNLGDVLIKEVVADLTSELPKLAHFATLSPIPGFRRWLDTRLTAGDAELLNGDDRRLIAELTPDGATGPAALAALLSDGLPAGTEDAKEARELLTGLCVDYLLGDGTGRSRDRVANFHLTNGAQVERLNWMANPTPAGMEESYGLMVNYRYDLSKIDQNHERYVAGGEIPRSSSIGRLANARRKARSTTRPAASANPT